MTIFSSTLSVEIAAYVARCLHEAATSAPWIGPYGTVPFGHSDHQVAKPQPHDKGPFAGVNAMSGKLS